MRALVTGGAGFIGSNLAALLLRRSHAVRILDNFSSGYRSNVEPLKGAEVLEGDIRDPAAAQRAAAGVDVIFHLAASVGNARSIADPLSDSEVNVLGTLRMLEAAREHGVRRFVYSSSAGVYGELKTLPIAETHPLDPTSPYGVSKLAGELHSVAAARLDGMQVVALRYFNVYGPHQRYDAYGNVIPIFVERMLAGEPLVVFGDGEQTRDFINVRDVVEANYLAATRNVSGVFNLGSGTRVSINSLIGLLQSTTEDRIVTTYAAPRAGDVRDSLADISQARERLGFEPGVALADGLREYVAWAASERARSTAAPVGSG